MKGFNLAASGGGAGGAVGGGGRGSVTPGSAGINPFNKYIFLINCLINYKLGNYNPIKPFITTFTFYKKKVQLERSVHYLWLLVT